jgi:hypothetical protein
MSGGRCSAPCGLFVMRSACAQLTAPGFRPSSSSSLEMWTAATSFGRLCLWADETNTAAQALKQACLSLRVLHHRSITLRLRQFCAGPIAPDRLRKHHLTTCHACRQAGVVEPQHRVAYLRHMKARLTAKFRQNHNADLPDEVEWTDATSTLLK